MAYDIRIDAAAADYTKLSTVLLRHEPEDADKIIRIRESLLRDGWKGRPVILMDCGDHHMAFTGCHRLAAAQGIEGVIEAAYLPDDLSQDEWDIIEQAHDDDDLLRAFEEVAAGRDDMGEVVEAMRAEVEANG